MNLIDDALLWFNEQRNEHLSELVTLVTSEGNYQLAATIIEPATQVNQAGIKVRTDKILFIVNTKDIESVRIQRGVKFVRDGYGDYEVVIDRTAQQYYNDPNNYETVIPTKQVSSCS